MCLAGGRAWGIPFAAPTSGSPRPLPTPPMPQPLRLVFRARSSVPSPETLWRGALLCGAAAAFIVARACAYEVAVPGSYLGYLLLHVALPAFVVVRFLAPGRAGFGRMLALGVPAGLTVESLAFLGLASVGAKAAHAWTPLLWLALAIVRVRRDGGIAPRISGHHAGLAAALAAMLAASLALAAGQMFAEAPLTDGMPSRGLFHDWVYLISRAAVIKNHWPLEDPSLAGTPLQYHYFLMVHAAAVSWTTGVEISTVLLRLVYVPLAAALLAQVFLLGRAVSRTPWGGVAACVLFLATSELSFSTSYGDSQFLGLFSRWLFVSPTFFFGLIYAGGLLVALGDCLRARGIGPRTALFLLLLGVGGTGAKGTVLPVMVAALALLTLWQWRRRRRLPGTLLLATGLMLAAFVVVYLPTMSAWRTGGARLNPFHIFELTGFWKQWRPEWELVLRRLLPGPVAAAIAGLACGLVAFAGTAGVRMLALPFLAWPAAWPSDRDRVRLLGAFLAASAGMGLSLELNSHGEIYLLLMMRLPMSVLAAGFLVAAVRRIAALRGLTAGFPAFLRLGAAVGVVGVALAIQASLWVARNAPGFAGWLRSPAVVRADAGMRDLAEAMRWVRANTERDAVLVANAWTPENTRRDHWGALDRTLLGVHFYYSAFAERRLWFEGHHYVLDGPLLSRRAAQASEFFYRGGELRREDVAPAPVYVLVDHAMKDDAHRGLPVAARLFSNPRISVYRLPVTRTGVVEGGASQQD